MPPIEIIPFDHFHSAPEVWDDYGPGGPGHDTSHPEIFVPPSGWKDDVLANIKSQVDMKHRSWNVSFGLQLICL